MVCNRLTSVKAALGALVLLAGCGGASSTNVATAADAVPVIATRSLPPEMQQIEAKKLFGAKPGASSQPALPFGSYAKGCMSGGVQLPETGPTWQAMRLSRNRNWGHPETIDFIKKLSAFAATQPGWEGLYVGDISQPRGGPMLTGHRSHQIGLDVDIWMLPPKRLNLTRAERENLSSISLRKSRGAYVNSNWSTQHMEIMKAAAKDPRVARIFVFPAAKVEMCKAETGDRSYLRKIRPWYGHHYHFHVRLSCPRGAKDCVEQAAPPAGDGCDDAQEWVNNILNPPPPDPTAPRPAPRRELRMTDLPGQCVAVLQSD
jgi:penicillin-insensitive murein endopeptidase